MIRRPPRSTLDRSSAASDVYKRQTQVQGFAYRSRYLREKAFSIWPIGQKGRVSRPQRHVAVGAGDNAGRRILDVRRKEIDAFDACIDSAGVFDDAVRPAVLKQVQAVQKIACLLYTSDAADERSSVDLGGRRIIKKKN